ncbi:MAG: hypothetical protein SPJ71_00330 [Candidatus Limisoma sp.]|nr:hypothetical protein [Bacteroidales bacterium]MDY5893008.1 hypothetical protein [Candidatus Limisoma sp.]MDY5900715.1 hypothetical protein [Candidatus Limisoma sp.]MDY6106545.1 hypothetical protein [Candidatus Limisoma sp.]
MEDDKLKSLFSNFEPELSSDFLFMNKLQRNLNSVELIKQHTVEVRSRSRKAVAIAAIVGFIVGFLFSLSLPYLSEAVSNWQLTLPSESVMNVFANNFTIIAWLVIGGTSVFAALNSYELSLSLLKPKETNAI